MIFKSYRCPLFGAQVNFVSECSFDEYVQVIRKKICADFNNESTGQGGQWSRFKTESGHRFWALWIDDKDKDSQIIVTHESLHVAEDILECLKVEASGEILAYYQCFWLRKFMKALNCSTGNKKVRL